MQTIGMHSESIADIIQLEKRKQVELKPEPVKIEEVVSQPKERSQFKHFEKYLHPAFICKSAVCKHEHGCFENCLRKAFKTFIYGFGSLMLLKVLSLASNPARLMRAL